MIDPATGWFEIHQYNDKRSIAVANIAETRMVLKISLANSGNL
jgi:hypothetical protein